MALPFLSRAQAFANPEDLSLASNKAAVVTTTDPDVERIRRNHLNDIENIVPFVLVGFFYVGTNPDRDLALWHFRIFFISRLLHTLTYQVRETRVEERGRMHQFLSSAVFSWLCHSPVDSLPAVWDFLPRSRWPCAFFSPSNHKQHGIDFLHSD